MKYLDFVGKAINFTAGVGVKAVELVDELLVQGVETVIEIKDKVVDKVQKKEVNDDK